MKRIVVLLVQMIVMLLASSAFCTQMDQLELDPISDASTEAEQLTFDGSMLTWQDEKPAKGEIVRTRITGDVRDWILKRDREWHVESSGVTLPAHLILPEPPTSHLQIDLTILEQSPIDSNELSILIDRLDSPKPINRISLTFTASKTLSRYTLLSSPDKENFTTIAKGAVFQQIDEGQLIRVTSIDLDQTSDRYLKLILPDVKTAQIESIAGEYVASKDYSLTEIECSLGPMRSLSDTENLWPLQFVNNALPLAKIKILSSDEKALRNIRIVRMDQDGNITSTVSDSIWLDGYNVSDEIFSNKWIEVFDPGGSNDGWALVVEDGEKAALQLTSIIAYVTDIELFFEMPSSTNIKLWLTGPSSPGLQLEALNDVILHGEFSLLSQRSIPAVEERTELAPWYQPYTETFKQWQWFLIYAVAGLILLFTGIALLRKPQPDGETDLD